MDVPIDYEHPSWQTAIGTVISYSLILVVMTIVLFVLPFVIFLTVL